MTVNPQYMEAARKAQETWLHAFESLTTQVSRSLGQPAAMPFPTSLDPREAVDEVFAFWGKLLEVQRETTQRVLTANIEIAEQWQSQAAQLQSVWREQMQAAAEMTRDQATSLTSTARDQVQSFNATMEDQVRTAGEAARQHANTVATSLDKHAETAAATVEEVAKRNYNLMNQAQLKAALTARKLDTSGSLDEMRARLRADDEG